MATQASIGVYSQLQPEQAWQKNYKASKHVAVVVKLVWTMANAILAHVIIQTL